jgi:hypothetical protein
MPTLFRAAGVPGAMRWTWTAALAALALAGCAAPDQPNPLLGLCPQWVAEPGGGHPGAFDGRSGAQVVRPHNLTYLGKPFDLVRLKVDALSANGTLELRAYASSNGTRGAQRNWRDYRTATPQDVPVLVLDAAAVGHEFEATLSSIAAGDAPRPGPLELAWTLPGGAVAHVAYTLTYEYKVCGL